MKHRHRIAMLLIGLCTVTGLLGCPPPNSLHSLTLGVSPPGSGFVVATPSQVTYPAGTEVTLQAIADTGWEFSHWEGNGLNASVETTSIALYQDEIVTAVFMMGGADAGNVVQDPGFEGGPNTEFWTQSSSNFASVVCDEEGCGSPGGLAAHTGKFWVYFGGTPTGAAETATVAQDVTVPLDDMAALQFYLAIPPAEAPFTLQVSLGPTMLLEVTEADQGLYRSYRRVSLDVSRYADGGTHTLLFSYADLESPDAATGILLDDVSLVAGVEADGGDSEFVTITSAPVLPDAEEDETYAFTLEAAGGSPPYLWTLTGEGTLPPGLNLTSGGTVRGTPPIDGTYTFEVRAADTEDESVEATFSLTVLGDVEGALTITSDLALPGGRVGQPYDFTFGAVGGDSPYLWSIIDDQSLPAGLDFTSGGTLNGIPVVAGVYTFEVEVSDTDGDTEDSFFTLAILPRGLDDGLTIASEPVLPDGEMGVEYDFTFSATGGTPPYTWSLAEGAVLPPGLALDVDGSLSGTPSSDGTHTLQVSVLDDEGETADKFFAITVQP